MIQYNTTRLDHGVPPTLDEAATGRIKARRVAFTFDDVPKHWLADSPVATHLANGLNLLFPHGERFFVRSVQKHLHHIDDPALRADAKAFFGQEGTHAREHERFFDILRNQGYEVDTFLERYERIAGAIERRMPDSLQLAVTAAAEHYTAVLGHAVLEDDVFAEAHPAVQQLLSWHAAEEIEHKSVAFDVLRASHPSYALRMLGLVVSSGMLVPFWLAGTAMLLRQDGFGLVEILGAFRQFGNNDRLGLAALAQAIPVYAKRNFHPLDVDDIAMAKSYLEQAGMAA
jgi:uncharacterized protein